MEKQAKGIPFAIAMLVIMFLEFAVVFDIHPATNDTFSVGKTAFFGYLLLAAVLQLAGLLLVQKGQYKTGGILQIIASAGHLIDLVGVIGIYGGLQAYRFQEPARTDTAST